MAKSTQERSEKSKLLAKAAGEEDLRLKVRPGIRAMLADLMRWHGIKQIAEALQLMIMNLHALGPAGSAQAFKVPRHEITISENVARRFYEEGAREAKGLDREEV
jgi:hypothetical protein